MFTQSAAPTIFANLAGFRLGNDEIAQMSTLREIADALVGRVAYSWKLLGPAPPGCRSI